MRLLAQGIDDREVLPDRDAKSIGAECTYEEDLRDREAIARTLLSHASRVAERLTEAKIGARAVVVKLKWHDFTVLTRRMTLPMPASDTQTLHDACLALLDRFPLEGARIRLTGVAVQDLCELAPKQAVLFPDRKAERRRDVENLLLKAKQRFGDKPITFATLLEDSAARTAPEGDLEKLPPRRR